MSRKGQNSFRSIHVGETRWRSLPRAAVGLTALHWGTGCRDAEYIEPFVKLFGGCHGGPDRKYQVLETKLKPADAEHPAARGLTPIEAHDEFYYRLKVPPGRAGAAKRCWPPRSMAKTSASAGLGNATDGGRSFGFTGLHFHENWSKPFYRRAVTNGVLWTLKIEIPKEGSPVDVDEGVLKLK